MTTSEAGDWPTARKKAERAILELFQGAELEALGWRIKSLTTLHVPEVGGTANWQKFDAKAGPIPGGLGVRVNRSLVDFLRGLERDAGQKVLDVSQRPIERDAEGRITRVQLSPGERIA